MRRGIVTAGTFVVDRVKLIRHWPDEETLTFIDAEERGNGGGAFNCWIDLARLQVDCPLLGCGCLGDDADGAWVRAHLAAHGQDDRYLQTVAAATSYTDVMTVAETGRRTFFHCPGANTRFGPEQVPLTELEARVLHLAYLLVLDRLDAPDPAYGCVGARLLADARAAGLTTVLDLITENSPRVQRIVRPALPQVDCLVINELEAGVLTGLVTRPRIIGAAGDSDFASVQAGSRLEAAAVRQAAAELLALGVRDRVVIHMPEGGYIATRDGRTAFRPSLALPPDYIAGAAGAGDAFAAGVLYGLHEGWELDELLTLAVTCAAASLSRTTCSDGVGPLAETLALAERFGYREPPPGLG